VILMELWCCGRTCEVLVMIQCWSCAARLWDSCSGRAYLHQLVAQLSCCGAASSCFSVQWLSCLCAASSLSSISSSAGCVVKLLCTQVLCTPSN
jgi:hypothetical protein